MVVDVIACDVRFWGFVGTSLKSTFSAEVGEEDVEAEEEEVEDEEDGDEGDEEIDEDEDPRRA